MALKSFTESRRVEDILNYYWYYANYHPVEEIKTELTYSVIESQNKTLRGINESSKK